MKKYFFMAAVATMMLASCSSDSDVNRKVEYYPVQLDKNSHWSMIGPDGKLLYEDEFKNPPTAVIDGMFSVQEGDGYTLYAAEAKPKAVLEDLKDVGLVGEGLIGIVHKHERIQFVDKKGKVKFTLNPIGDKEITMCSSAFTDGLLIICDEDNKTGAVDSKGNVVIKPRYEGLTPFNEGLSVAYIVDEDGETKYRIIDKKGEDVAKIRQDISIEGSVFQYGRIPAKQGDDDDARYGFIDKKGEFTKLPEKVRGIFDYNEKYVIFRDDDYNCGVMNYDGEVLIRAKYQTLRFIDGGSKFLAEQSDDRYVVLDSKGEKLQSLDYSHIGVLDGNGFNLIAKDGSTYMLIDYDGKQVGKYDFVDYSASITMSYVLKSDYFPTQSVANQIADAITTKSISKYTLGSTPEEVFSGESASDYPYRSRVTLYDDLFKSHYFSANVVLEFSEYVAISRYEYNSYSWYGSYTYYWNSDSRLNEIELVIGTTNGEWKSFSNALADALEDRGFRVEDDSDDRSKIVLTSGSSTLIISKETDTLYKVTLSRGNSIVFEEVTEEAPAEEYYDEAPACEEVYE